MSRTSRILGGVDQYWAAVLAGIAAATAVSSTYKVVVTGHSLGAVVGTFAVAEVLNDGPFADVYNYRSRVSNDIFADLATKRE